MMRPVVVPRAVGHHEFVRDEHFAPQNVYFCSQNCLLARGMPSHAKSERERIDRARKAT